ncbi:MAG TPA: hypothetical protein VK177_03085 [Flavobacteriales bacterium]|nr:hypothetical protein [Flavobacteriales bacterium]
MGCSSPVKKHNECRFAFAYLKFKKRESVNDNLRIQRKSPCDDFIPDSKILYELTKVIGDFDNDTVPDIARLMIPISGKESDCYGCDPCITKVVFSNGISSLQDVEGQIGRFLQNAGDIDGDGIDELAYSGGGIHGCRCGYGIYSLKQHKWKKVGHARAWNCEGGRPYAKWVKRVNDSIISLVEEDATEGDYDLRFYKFPLVKDTLKSPAN